MKNISKLAAGLVLLMALCMVASACPWCSGNFGSDVTNGGTKYAGKSMTICGPTAPLTQTWTYQWLVWYWDPATSTYKSRAPTSVSIDGRCITETPLIGNCDHEFGATLTVTNAASGLSCILYKCVYFNIICPACPTMTNFCEGDATTANEPQGTTTGFTYTYTKDGSAFNPIEANLDLLAPGSYTIVATINPGGKVCTPPITLVVGDKPSGPLTITP